MTVTIATDRRPRHQRNRYRFDRLMRYKEATHRRIEADGWHWRLPKRAMFARLKRS